MRVALGVFACKGQRITNSQDRHPALPPSAVPPSPSRSTRQTTPPYTTFFCPPPHISIVISCVAMHLPTTSCRPSESRLLLPSRSGSTGDPLHTPAPRHGPYGVHLHVFFRPSDCEEVSQCFDVVAPVAQSRECPTCMNHRYVYCSIRSLLARVPRTILRKQIDTDLRPIPDTFTCTP